MVCQALCETLYMLYLIWSSQQPTKDPGALGDWIICKDSNSSSMSVCVLFPNIWHCSLQGLLESWNLNDLFELWKTFEVDNWGKRKEKESPMISHLGGFYFPLSSILPLLIPLQSSMSPNLGNTEEPIQSGNGRPTCVCVCVRVRSALFCTCIAEVEWMNEWRRELIRT